MAGSVYPGFTADEPTSAGRALVTAADAAAQLSLLGIDFTPADDAAVVHLAGAESISGAKTFTGGATINQLNMGSYGQLLGTAGMAVLSDGSARIGLDYAGKGLQVASGKSIGFAASATVDGSDSDVQFKRVSAGVVGVYQADGATLGNLRTAAVDISTASLTIGNATHGVTSPGSFKMTSGALTGTILPESYMGQFRFGSNNYSRLGVLSVGYNAGGQAAFLGGIGGWASNLVLGLNYEIQMSALNIGEPYTLWQAVDCSLARSATGPAWVAKAAGGLRVRNLADSAFAPITAGSGTFNDTVTARATAGQTGPHYSALNSSGVSEFSIAQGGNMSAAGVATFGGALQQGYNDLTASYRSRLLAIGQHVSEVGDGAGSWQSGYREEYNASGIRCGFYDATPTARQQIDAASGTLAADILTALDNLGLVQAI